MKGGAGGLNALNGIFYIRSRPRLSVTNTILKSSSFCLYPLVNVSPMRQTFSTPGSECMIVV